MNDYPLLREMVENWGLLWLFGAFIVAVVWVFRPGSKRLHDDSAQIPFMYDDKPADSPRGEADLEEARP